MQPESIATSFFGLRVEFLFEVLQRVPCADRVNSDFKVQFPLDLLCDIPGDTIAILLLQQVSLAEEYKRKESQPRKGDSMSRETRRFRPAPEAG